MNRPSAMTFLFVTVFVDMLGYGLVVPLLPFYAGGLANGALLVGALGSLYAAMQFFGGPFLAGLSDRTGRRPVLVACLLGASLAYALLGIAETLTLVVAAVALAGAAGGTQATAQAFVADSTPPEDRARGLGLIGAAFGLGLMAGPLLGGLLSLHSLSAPALAASGLALANAAFGLFALPEDRRSRTPLLRLDPASGLVRTIRMGGTGPSSSPYCCSTSPAPASLQTSRSSLAPGSAGGLPRTPSSSLSLARAPWRRRACSSGGCRGSSARCGWPSGGWP